MISTFVEESAFTDGHASGANLITWAFKSGNPLLAVVSRWRGYKVAGFESGERVREPGNAGSL